MIVFISCVKTKLPYEEMAKNLYCSNYFKTCYKYAEFLKPDNIYILSAKYGLLEPNDLIEPYELTLNKMSIKERKQWAEKVIGQLKNKNVSFNQKAVFLCGNKYNQFLKNKFVEYETPLCNMGFGYQIQYMNNEMKKYEKILDI